MTASRFSRLALWVALAAPALAFAPYAQHAFTVPEAVLIVPLAWLAAGLAWRGEESPPRLPLAFWGPALLGALLASLVFGRAQLGRVARWVAWLHLEHPRWEDALPRAALLWAAVALGCLAWQRRRPQADLGRVPFLGLSLAMVAALAGVFAIRPDLSLRAVVEQLCYPLIFAAAVILARQAGQGRRLAWLLLWVGALNSAYGLLQVAGLDPLPWNQAFGGRASGFFGNPDLLGGHLALLLPLALALGLRPGPGRAWPAWALALWMALGLFATQTRGAWIGAAVGCALVIGWAWRHGELTAGPRRVLGVGALLLLLAAGGWMARDPQLLQRLVATVTGHDVEAGRRAFLLEKTAELAAKHPLLGVGPGNFRIAFPSVEVVGRSLSQYDQVPYVVSEHGHNDLLQWAAEAGWAAALLWAALLLTAFRLLVVRLREGGSGDAGLALGALGGLAALTVHGLANYPYQLLPTEASAWALVAVALALPVPAAQKAEARPRPRWWGGLGLVLAVSGAFLWQGRRLAMDHLWWVGQGELTAQHFDNASNLLLRTLALDRREDRLWKLHGQSEYARGHIWDSIGSLRESVRQNPYDAEAAVRLGRSCVENRLYPEAEAVLYKVSQYAPNFIDLWEPLAAAYYSQQKYPEAIKAYDWMLYFHVNDESAYANKAASLGNLGRLPDALLCLLQAEQVLPQSGKVQINLAITYLKLGMRKEAKAAWAKAAQLIPSDPQVDLLRKALR